MYKVEIQRKSATIFNVKSKTNEFLVDKKGEEGISPPDTLLAGLGSCVSVYIEKYLQGRKIKTEDFKVIVNAEFCKENPVRFKEIYIKIDLKGIKLEEKAKERLLQFIKNCPVHRTLENRPEINTQLIG